MSTENPTPPERAGDVIYPGKASLDDAAAHKKRTEKEIADGTRKPFVSEMIGEAPPKRSR